MTVAISRLYDDYSTASQVVRDLEAAGLRPDDISIIANNADNRYRDDRGRKMDRIDRDHDGKDDRVEGAEAGAGIGAVVGGTAGLLAGLGILAIPGVGPVVAAGWLAALATGALAGGAAGGIIGALTQSGVSKEDAHVYAEGLRRGGALVTARVPDGERTRYETILDRAAVNIRERGEAYRKEGWKSFDESAPAYSAEQARREREIEASSQIGRPL
jgi:hypothetical protein